jgi:uncharacterized membrane protein
MERASNRSLKRRLAGHLTRTVGTGLLILVPVMIAYLVLRLLFDAIDGILQPGVEAIVGRKIPGLGAVIILILIYVVGLVGAFFAGKWLIRLGQNVLSKVPVIGVVYSSARQLIESFSGSSTTGFKRVVLIEYPRAGTWTVGFLTGMTSDESGKTLALVYIPNAPIPNSGLVFMLPVQDVYDTDLSVQQALHLVLSGGIVAPPQIRKKALEL